MTSTLLTGMQSAGFALAVGVSAIPSEEAEQGDKS
jgi:hypothetical protein